ncbi:mitochondrial potassium channel [Lepeophtheirus salmonis]|uniref:Coiled-coil domain-containing protein 51 n=1 Tax=Lepeophtheirus salmonis TaxID=72036 RepID=D3PIY5_LEPSM|nr:mitochondrial potassium channel-like [Lepeophtheirus salmonis]ADD38521.1 Coiled-coil domain-containing protein 51 [Lepeophtheirus salmonis]
MGSSMKPFLIASGKWSRLYIRRGLCNPLPPPTKKNETSESTWNVEKISKEMSNRMEELKTFIRPSLQKTQDSYVEKANFWMRRYEKFVGITEVKIAQHRVITAEQEFIQSQEHRREVQSKITELQNSIKTIHSELEKTFRGEDRYLVLVTQEHQVLKEEKLCLEEFKRLERVERDRFSILSNTVRDSHEKERAQTEKTKYWSVIGSIFGSLLGLIGSNINNRLKMKELRELIEKASSGTALEEMYSTFSIKFKHLEDRFKFLSHQIDGSVKGFIAASSDYKNIPSPPKAIASDANTLPDSLMKEKVQEMNHILKDLTMQLKLLSTLVSKESQKYQAKTLELSTNFEKHISALRTESKNHFEEISVREESLRDKMKDIISLLLSSTWNTQTFNSNKFKDSMAEYNRENKHNSDLIADSVKVVATGAVILSCTLYVAYQFFG